MALGHRSARPARPDHPRRPWRLAVLAVASAVTLTGCFSSGYTYLKSSDDRTYLKVPDGWKVYGEDELFASIKHELSDEEFELFKDSRWRTAFDASSSPALKHTSVLNRRDPVGVAMVSPLGAEESDQVSYATLRNLVVDADAALDADQAEMLAYRQVTRPGGFRGIEMVLRLTPQDGPAVTLNEVALLDSASTKVYLLAVFCTSACYQRNRSQIETVIESWTVKDD